MRPALRRSSFLSFKTVIARTTLLVLPCSSYMTTVRAMSTSTTSTNNDPPSGVARNFFVIQRESGKIRRDLPVWASRLEDPFQLGSSSSSSITAEETCSLQAIQRREVESVPGAFQLLDVLTRDEAQRIVEAFEELGYTEDAAVSLPRSVRHNWNLVWIADDTTQEILWNRCKHLIYDKTGTHFQNKQPLGLNGRFRSYKYSPNDFFKLHSDGSWVGTRVLNGTVVPDAYGDRRSMYTFLIFLNDDYEGGETEFWVNDSDPSKPAYNSNEARMVPVRTPTGGVLAFPHGDHPLHCLHASSPIRQGTKYIIRTDVLFEL